LALELGGGRCVPAVRADISSIRVLLVPQIVAGSKPAHEIEYPLALVILGGLVTSTLLNLFLLPPLYLLFGHQKEVRIQ
jgi:Cu/Ag efflux pump CusA